MQSYKMVTQTSTGGLQWEYNFDMASDAMATDYAMRHTAQFACVPWFMSMVLFKDEAPGTATTQDWVFVAEYAPEDKPRVRMIERRR
jgi:hypothetical protein